MAFITTNKDFNRFEIALSDKANEYLTKGRSDKLKIKFFGLSDRDSNYFISTSINTTGSTNTLDFGHVPSYTGLETFEGVCVGKLSKYLSGIFPTVQKNSFEQNFVKGGIEFTIDYPSGVVTCEVTE